MANAFNFFLVNVVNGAIYGSFLLLTSLGLSLVFGLGRVVNFAHGAFYAVGGYIAATLLGLGFTYWPALMVVPFAVFAFGLLVEFVFIRPLRRRPEVDTLLVTFGLSSMIVGSIEFIWGTSTTIIKQPYPFEGAIQVLSNDYPVYRFVAAGLSLVVAAAVLAGIQWTSWGLRIRAIADDAEMAEAAGIDRSGLLMWVFGMAAGLAGLAGALGAPIFAVHPEMGLAILIDSFLVVVIGGLGSLKGSVIGAFLVAMTKSIGGGYLAEWSTAILFLAVAAMLVFRPTGIFATGRVA